MSDLPLLYWGQKVGACLMLSEYQSTFYNMMVKGEQEKLKEYVGSTLPWQFRVYQGNYFNSLFSSLNKTYRRFITLVSPDFCRDIFSDYIAENPSINQNLSEYGLDLSIWLKANSGQYVIPRCATEMAELDALLHLSYYQSNTPAFNAKQLSVFKPHPLMWTTKYLKLYIEPFQRQECRCFDWLHSLTSALPGWRSFDPKQVP